MKECEKIREWMTAYLAGELSPEDAAVLRPSGDLSGVP